MIDKKMDMDIKRSGSVVLAVVGFCCLLLSGCSDNLPTHKVVGTVEFPDGTKPKFGDIEFYSEQLKINAHGEINRDGTFTVSTYEKGDGAVAGPQKIIIMQQVGNYLNAKSQIKVKHDHGSLIDRKHFDYRTSGLNCEIEPGENQVRLIVERLPRQTEEGLPK